MYHLVATTLISFSHGENMSSSNIHYLASRVQSTLGKCLTMKRKKGFLHIKRTWS